MPTPRRTSTTTGTIPAGTNATGTVTASTINNTRLLVSGTTNDAFKAEHGAPIRSNQYLYIPSTGAISKIVGYSFNDAPLIILEQSVGAVSGVAFQIIDGNLTAWEVANVGAADGVLDGATFSQNRSLALSAKEYPINRYLDVITFNATGTTFEITEIR